MPYVDAIGAKLYFEVQRDGHPVILVREFAHNDFRSTVIDLAIVPAFLLHPGDDGRGYRPELYRTGRAFFHRACRTRQRALNFFHVGVAVAVQCATGLVLRFWPPDAGHYAVIAYQIALVLDLVPQLLAAAWLVIPWLWRAVERGRRASPDIRQPCKIRQVQPTSVSGCVSNFLNGRSS